MVTSPPGGDKRFELKPDVLVAEAELRPNEIQDLAEHLAEIRKAAGAFDLKFRLRLELDGRGAIPGTETIAELNDIFAKVSKHRGRRRRGQDRATQDCSRQSAWAVVCP
jgi:hypothetical protein